MAGARNSDSNVDRNGNGSMVVEPARRGPAFEIYELRFAADFLEKHPGKFDALAKQLGRCVLDVRANCDPTFRHHAAATGRVDSTALSAFKAKTSPPPMPPQPTSRDLRSPAPFFNVKGRVESAQKRDVRRRDRARTGPRFAPLSEFEQRAHARLGLKDTGSARLLSLLLGAQGTPVGAEAVREIGVTSCGKAWNPQTVKTVVSNLRCALGRAGVDTMGRRPDRWRISPADAARIKELVQ